MVTGKGKRTGRPNRELSQQTKRELLAVGAREFFNNPSAANPFRGLTLDRIARMAGKARNTVYLHWQDKESYLADLTRYLLGDPGIFEKDFEEIQNVARESSGTSILDALCVVANAEIATLQGNDVWRAMEVLAVGYMPFRPELHGVACEGYDAVDEETYELYRIVLDRHGRTPRPPFTTASIGKVVQALTEGAGIRQIFDQRCFVDPVGPGAEYGVYANAVAVVLALLTAGPNDPRSLDDVLRELFDIRDAAS